MLKKFIFTLPILMAFSIFSNAQERDEESMRQIAMDAIIQLRGENLANARNQSSGLKPEKIKASDELSVYSIKEKGFAVVSHDEQFPAILGVSDSDFPESNEALNWWLKAINESLAIRKENGQTPRSQLTRRSSVSPSNRPIKSTRGI